ncbi:2-oxoglutarate and iron-dependent oxygenase domain-containing protein [uncultured Roseibium sp.]|uniref:isopenicillin N synthase family dioxygenase n=1 Tax=uncultured Roseibium sp. TaxID=1936171 RepID=UPI0032180096
MNTSLDAKRVAGDALPIVDVSDLCSPDFEKRKAVGARLRAACEDKGFFYCAGHGIPKGLIDAVFAETKTFFDQPEDTKLKIEKSKVSKANRGYEVLGGQVLEAGTPPDRKEGYYIGLELPADDPRVVAGQFNRGPNVWPEGLPGFEPTMAAYFEAMRRLSQRLMKGIALSLDLDEDYFEIFNRDPVATLRLLHYPPQRENAEPNEKGAGAHTDWGALTLLLQDDVGGLQVYDKNTGEWLHADPVPGTFVINLGDALAHWTNDLYKSTLHRVVNASGRERYSVPFFYDGDADFEVTCIPTCLKPGEEPKYAPITVEGHLMNMYRKSYG